MEGLYLHIDFWVKNLNTFKKSNMKKKSNLPFIFILTLLAGFSNINAQESTQLNNQTLEIDDATYKGQTLNGKPDGQGTYTWANGTKYEGEFSGGNLHGKGTVTTSTGDKYKGEFRSNLRHGKGTFYFSTSGDKYEGDWKNDEKNGQGIYTYSNGSKYEGNFKDGSKDGRGILTYPNGTKYRGEWKNDKKDGQGTYTNIQGYKFGGEWISGTLNGEKSIADLDKLSGSDARLDNQTIVSIFGSVYKGQALNGKPDGYGTRTWSEPTKYVGEWKEGKFHGQGKYTNRYGREFSGKWVNDRLDGNSTNHLRQISKNDHWLANQVKETSVGTYRGYTLNRSPHGNGTFTYIDGSKYTGGWMYDLFKNSVMDGQGTFVFKGGEKYVGNWKDGLPHHQGTYTNQFGREFSGKWVDGRLDGKDFEELNKLR